MTRKQFYNKQLVLIVVALAITAGLRAQSVATTSEAHYFVNEEKNVILNDLYLDDFLKKLFALKTTGTGKINIVHIGDSHIQADFQTEVVRKHLQREFGNAGRGLIVPARVAGTNEPFNFRTSSSHVWNAKRCVHLHQPLPIGVGGITIHTNQPHAKIKLSMNDPLGDYDFNAITLVYQKDEKSFHYVIQDSLNNEIGIIKPHPGDTLRHHSRVELPGLYRRISITTAGNEEQNHATVFGLNLENGNDGVLYHALGVNGAKYAHYNAATLFAEQTQLLQPDLFIISLGTNESVEYPYTDKNLYQHISTLVSNLIKYNPQAKVMLVTPPDAFRKKIKHNPGIEEVRDHILRFAVDNGLAFWDMYEVNGGKYSASIWKDKGLLRPDGVHFTKDGYAYQGNLLFRALMKAYEQYAQVRVAEEIK